MIRRLMFIFLGIAIFWLLLTIYAQFSGSANIELVKSESGDRTALILFNPDPFYNLDHQICKSLGEGLARQGFDSWIVTTKQSNISREEYDLLVICSNTYNWAPDWGVTRFIQQNKPFDQQPVIAITLGSGSTSRSEKLLQYKLNRANAKVIASYHLWLMRPNDESKMDRNNVEIANELARKIGQEIEI